MWKLQFSRLISLYLVRYYNIAPEFVTVLNEACFVLSNPLNASEYSLKSYLGFGMLCLAHKANRWVPFTSGCVLFCCLSDFRPGSLQTELHIQTTLALAFKHNYATLVSVVVHDDHVGRRQSLQVYSETQISVSCFTSMVTSQRCLASK